MVNECLHIILSICCEVFEISIENIKSNKSIRNIIRARKAYSVIAKKKYDLSLNEIGNFIGKDKCQIHNYIENQPTDNFYKLCLKKSYEKVTEKL